MNTSLRRMVGVGLMAGAVLLAAGCQSAQQKLQRQGVAAYQTGDYETALNDFNEVLKDKPFDAEANYYAGNAALQLGRLETAAYHYKLAWQANPGLADVKDALTTTYLRLGKPNEALDFLERDAQLTAKMQNPANQRYIGMKPKSAEIQELMYENKALDRERIAATYEKLGDLDNAKVYFEQAVKMSPKDPAVLIPAASFFARIGQKDHAAELFEQVYKVNPQAEGLQAAMEKAGMQVTWQ